MANLPLKVKSNAPATGFLSHKELERLAASFEVCLPTGVQLVHFGMNPPANSGLRWQQTDETGAHIGQIKTYQNGEWL